MKMKNGTSLLEGQTGTTRNPLPRNVDAKNRQTMQAAYLENKAGIDGFTIGEIPRPSPATGEVLVKVHATAIMPTELQWFPTFNLATGEPRPFPVVLSHEFSGVVEAAGEKVNGFEVGDEVYGLNDWFINGAQAEFCVVQMTAFARKPKSLDHVQSAVVPISALTAWQGLFERAKLERGQRVLIHGAAGGVGNFAVQLAHRQGAHVITPVSAGNMDFVRSLGADQVFDYRTTRFEDVVKEVDVVFDGVGGETLERSWSVLAKGGKLVTFSTESEKSTEPRVHDAYMLVRADGSQLAEIAKLIDGGELHVFVADVFPLAETKKAYSQAQKGGKRGKVALQVIR